MAYIKYRIYPDDPEATKAEYFKAYRQFLFGFFVLFGGGGSLIYLIYSVASFASNGLSNDLLYSTVVLLVMSVIGFFSIFSGFDKEIKKLMAKNYFLFFFGGTITLSAIIYIVVAISNGKTDRVVFAASIIVLPLTVLAVYLLYTRINRIERHKIRFFTDEAALNEIILEQQKECIETSVEKPLLAVTLSDTQEQYVYCHKCGKKELSDSMFCSSCGTKLN